MKRRTLEVEVKPVIIAHQSPRFHTTTLCSALRGKLDNAFVTTMVGAKAQGMEKCKLECCASSPWYDVFERDFFKEE
jgi:hypothetical protein